MYCHCCCSTNRKGLHVLHAQGDPAVGHLYSPNKPKLFHFIWRQTKPQNTACCHCSQHPIVCPSAATKSGWQKKVPTRQTLENTKPFISGPFHPAITSLSIPFQRRLPPLGGIHIIDHSSEAF